MTPLSESTDANLVLTLEEITNLAEQEGKPADTLMNVVALIATRFRTDVCSAYLLEPDRSNLVLAATLGLHPRAIGTLRMPLHEGLSGLVAEQLVPVAVPDAREHPRYKYFKESGEEEYRSFLGVPLIDRGVLQGVLGACSGVVHTWCTRTRARVLSDFPLPPYALVVERTTCVFLTEFEEIYHLTKYLQIP